MTESRAKTKARRTARASGVRKPAAGTTRPANARKQAKGPAKTRAKAKPVAKAADWREQTLARMRALILEADPEMIEERKWKKPSNAMAGVPVWSHNGIVCTGETYKNVVKLTFAQGASLPDPSHLFNSSLEGKTRRAIDIHEGEEVDADAFQALVQAAVTRNGSPTNKGKPAAAAAKPVKLLSGGNPQITKADGDAPVQDYIAAMPGWKNDLGKRLDSLISRTVPKVRKGVKWNSPFYGVHGQGWFMSFHVFTHYVKVSFFRGASLRPVPPGGMGEDARWIDIHEDDLDEAQMVKWVKQASALPGWLQ